jgi:type I restriction enzyme S subunit
MKYFMKLYYDHGLVGIYQVQSTGISNYQFESFLKYQTIMIPPEKIQLDFEKYVGPLVELRDSLGIANIHLRRSRDRLLPRLISGRLSVENLSIQFPPGMKDEASASLPDDEEATEKEVRYA